MPNHDIADHPLIAALQDAFGELVEDHIVDIVPPDEHESPDTCEIQADTWTLVLEGWPLANAWIAIDDDPSDPGLARPALASALDLRDLEAMATLDDVLGGALVTSLAESDDDLSRMLSELIAARV